MLGVESVQFSLYQGRKRLSYGIFSLVLYSARCILGLESVQFFYRVGKLSYSIFSPVLYSARCMLGVESVQFSLHQGRKS